MVAWGMPSFTKLASVTGSSMRRANSPRSCGPSTRAVITLVPTPSAVTAICVTNTEAESRTNLRIGTDPAAGQRRGTRLGVERIQRVAALADDRRVALAGDEAPPQPRHRSLEWVASRLEPAQVDCHVGHAEPVRRG